MPNPTPAKPALVSTTTSAEAIAAIRGLIRRGEYLAGYDAAEEAEQHPFDPGLSALALAELRYLRTLALTRSGGLRRATAEAEALIGSLPPDLPIGQPSAGGFTSS